MVDMARLMRNPQRPAPGRTDLFGTDAPNQTPSDPTIIPIGSDRGRQTRAAVDLLSFGDEATFGDGFLTGLSEGLINNALNAPAAPGRLVSAAVSGVGQLIGVDLNDLAKRFEATPLSSVSPMFGFSQIPQEALPQPTDVLAAGEAGLEGLGNLLSGQAPDFQNNFALAQVQQEIESQRVRDQAPGGTLTGEVAADALTIAGVRSPAAILQGRRAPLLKKADQIRQAPAKITLPVIGEKVKNSAPVKALLRGLGRGAEAGLEGAFLASLQSNDPVDIASVSAGAALGQIGGSTVLPFLPSSKKGFAGLAIAAAGLTAAFRLGQEYSPGENNVFTAIDQSFEKLAIGLLAGTGAYLAGAGRIRPRNSSAVVSIMADGLNAIPRGAVISIWDEVLREQKAGRSFIENGFAALAADPGGFTDKEQREIRRAITDPKVSLSETFEKLGIGTE